MLEFNFSFACANTSYLSSSDTRLAIIGGLVCLDLRKCTISSLISSELPIPSLSLINVVTISRDSNNVLFCFIAKP